MFDTTLAPVTITRLTPDDAGVKEYAAMRAQMWDIAADSNEREIRGQLEDQDNWGVFLACVETACVGFVEIWLREYAEGASTSPVGYIEGWFVDPDHRCKGIGRLLVDSAEAWARSRGCTEMASDSEIDNAGGIRAHRQLGYEEVNRIVCFLKKL